MSLLRIGTGNTLARHMVPRSASPANSSTWVDNASDTLPAGHLIETFGRAEKVPRQASGSHGKSEIAALVPTVEVSLLVTACHSPLDSFNIGLSRYPVIPGIVLLIAQV